VFIHGAGIIEDKLIPDKTPESFDRVAHTKTDSSWLLARHLRADSLKCLVFMSSITAAFGNRGQADYAAANGFMNGLAAELNRKWRSRVVAMNWGPWDQGGMVTDEVRQQFLSRRVQMIAPGPGAEALVNEIIHACTEPIVALGDGYWSEDKPVEDAAAVRAGS
jgi:NAD(P)-dependent dehydrogenase (short-subunit alcohol dehydrogenase family)